MSVYEVPVCPLCGEQVQVDETFGEGHCHEHGEVEPLTVQCLPISPTRARAWKTKYDFHTIWKLTDPRMEHWNMRSKVIDTFDPHEKKEE